MAAEIKCFRGLLWHLEADWNLKWNCMVTQSDSSLSGWGVKTAFWPEVIVQSVGRVRERSRFRRVGPHSFRECALETAGFVFREGQWCRGADGPEADDDAWDIDHVFPEVPAAGLRDSLWQTALSGA